ncbi:hypothetical protein MMPV_001653 [Pyropia vietnamensis]
MAFLGAPGAGLLPYRLPPFRDGPALGRPLPPLHAHGGRALPISERRRRTGIHPCGTRMTSSAGTPPSAPRGRRQRRRFPPRERTPRRAMATTPSYSPPGAEGWSPRLCATPPVVVPPQLRSPLRRLLTLRPFLNAVAVIGNCPVVRFTGVLVPGWIDARSGGASEWAAGGGGPWGGGGGDIPFYTAIAGEGVGGLGGPGGRLETYLDDSGLVVVAVPPAFLQTALWGGNAPPVEEVEGGRAPEGDLPTAAATGHAARSAPVAKAGAAAAKAAAAAAAAASSPPPAVDCIMAASLPWYAVYERLGVPSMTAELEADFAHQRAMDVAAQLEAWTDDGDTWRTETDVGRPDIPWKYEEQVYDCF